ncbi:MAG: site-2 protease family protein [Armatimonadetes bacterium]|nr:site-2 protease family protein [Armatimonadota bacterium]
MSGNLDPAAIVGWIVALAVALTVHEFAHAKRADMAGDPTPRMNGRVSLNPLDHYDVVGTTMILLFGIGWGKPVPVNPMLFRHPRRDGIMVALWGALANIIAAVVFSIPLWLTVIPRFAAALSPYYGGFQMIVLLNLILAVFNLLPVGPLDGQSVVSGLLPADKARKFNEFSARWGMMLLLLIIVTPLGSLLIWTPVQVAMTLLITLPQTLLQMLVG